MQWCNSSLISVNLSLPNHTQVRFQQAPTIRGELNHPYISHNGVRNEFKLGRKTTSEAPTSIYPSLFSVPFSDFSEGSSPTLPVSSLLFNNFRSIIIHLESGYCSESLFLLIKKKVSSTKQKLPGTPEKVRHTSFLFLTWPHQPFHIFNLAEFVWFSCILISCVWIGLYVDNYTSVQGS